ncbi:MBL fold metallo-hydrolase [Halorubrum sp. CBA1125]|uniref:MBL fold metallo-hydrolase n=1 Tax=Halorubrum sp. CBA1125 TaxID=2668072 RepID=UPI0012E70C1C|nr:MBL fold metallo-hydrolase [Halorubrum sp. CBA1125]MUW13366.1 MBL fold metallo-hydrolase [Halorubrum sp. CBA1125]
MICSTWGDWFVSDEIEATDPDGLSIWYLGCNGFVLRTAETTVYIDPYFGNGKPPWTIRMIPVPMDPADATMCDAVLVTHEHIDHMHEPSFRPLVENCGATICAPEASYENPDLELEHEVPAEQKRVIRAGDTLQIGDLTVHVRGGNDPDAIEEVSYVVEHESGTFFNGGDSRPTEAFYDIGEEFDIDVGSLTFGTAGRIHHQDEDETRVERWYSDENDVVEMATALQLDRLLPCHHDMWKGVRGDPTSLFQHAASFEYPTTIEPVQIGDRVTVGSPGIASLRSIQEGWDDSKRWPR